MLSNKQIIETLSNGIVIVEDILSDNSKCYGIHINTQRNKTVVLGCDSLKHAKDVASVLESVNHIDTE